SWRTRARRTLRCVCGSMARWFSRAWPCCALVASPGLCGSTQSCRRASGSISTRATGRCCCRGRPRAVHRRLARSRCSRRGHRRCGSLPLNTTTTPRSPPCGARPGGRRDMTNPLWINADGGQPEYTAQSLRLSMSGLLTKGVPDRLGARPGVIPNGRDAVSLSGVQVTVHDCNVVLNPALSAQDGPYIAHFTEHTHTLDPGDGSNARIDIVVARVYDDDHDGSGQREAVTELITGNPSPSPARPAVPAGALL